MVHMSTLTVKLINPPHDFVMFFYVLQVKDYLFMKLTKLAFALTIGGSLMLTQTASATWIENIHGSDGVRGFLIGGSLNPELSGYNREFNYVYGNPNLIGDPDGDTPHLQSFFESLDEEARIERKSLNAQMGVDNAIIMRVNRRINDKDYVVGSLALSPDSQRKLLSAEPMWGVQYIREDLGDISFGRMGVTINPQATNTYSPFTSVNRNSGINGATVTFDRYKNWNAKAFYSLPTTDNVLKPSAMTHSGYGAMASYTQKITPNHYVTVEGGYSTFERSPAHNRAQLIPNVGGRNIYQAPIKEHNYGGSITYRYVDWTVALDMGRKEGKIPGAPIVDSVIINNLGLKVAYQATPRLTLAGTYGIQKSNANEVEKWALSVPQIFPKPKPDSSKRLKDYLQRRIFEQYLFKQVHSRQVKLEADYKFSDNFSGKAVFVREKIENFAPEGKFSERQNTEYGLGLTYLF